MRYFWFLWPGSFESVRSVLLLASSPFVFVYMWINWGFFHFGWSWWIQCDAQWWTAARTRRWIKKSMCWSSGTVLRRDQNHPFTPSDMILNQRLSIRPVKEIYKWEKEMRLPSLYHTYQAPLHQWRCLRATKGLIRKTAFSSSITTLGSLCWRSWAAAYRSRKHELKAAVKSRLVSSSSQWERTSWRPHSSARQTNQDWAPKPPLPKITLHQSLSWTTSNESCGPRWTWSSRWAAVAAAALQNLPVVQAAGMTTVPAAMENRKHISRPAGTTWPTEWTNHKATTSWWTHSEMISSWVNLAVTATSTDLQWCSALENIDGVPSVMCFIANTSPSAVLFILSF